MTTPLDMTAERIARYRAAALQRQQEEAAAAAERAQAAWQTARQVAGLLRHEFNVSRVAVFGSLARGHGFTRWSDVDIAAWGSLNFLPGQFFAHVTHQIFQQRYCLN